MTSLSRISQVLPKAVESITVKAVPKTDSPSGADDKALRLVIGRKEDNK